MLDFLVEAQLPFAVVLTKTDKLSPSALRERLLAFRRELPWGEQLTLIPYSAQTSAGREELRALLDGLEEELLREGEEAGE